MQAQGSGATREEWLHFDLLLGWTADLLPVVPDPNATPGPKSKVKKFGKIPSFYGSDGCAYGIGKWQEKLVTPDEVSYWSRDGRYSICVRAQTVRAIDVDVTDPALADQVWRLIQAASPGISWPRRTRSNSSKFLLPFKLAGEYSKGVLKLADSKHIIEFLANGQQWVCAGPHESGARYEWEGGLPNEIPELTRADFLWIWTQLQERLGFIDVKSAAVPANEHTPDQGPSQHTQGVTGEGSTSVTETAALLTTIDEGSLNDLKKALSWPALVKLADDENSSWSEVGYALLSLGATGRQLFADFSAQITTPHPNRGSHADWWARHVDQAPRSDWRHIINMARRLGLANVAPAEAFGEPIADAQRGGSQDSGSGGASSQPELSQLLAPAPARPTIRIIGGELHNYAREAEALLSKELYAQGSHLVRVGEASELPDATVKEGDRGREARQPVLIEATMAYLERRLTELVRFEKYNKTQEEWLPIDCPIALAGNIVNQRAWPIMRKLAAIATAPFMRRDGTVCDVSGYDPSSAVLYSPNAEFLKVAEEPTPAEAARALDVLREPFLQFPFANEHSESAFLAHILTEVARPALETSPLFWYSAPKAGTGKSLLADMPALITHGVLPARSVWVGDTEEMRKNLYSALLIGDRSITFDNVPTGHTVRSSVLCGFLTSEIHRDRKLGESNARGIVNRAVVTCSGNNATPGGDLARRTVVIVLDANMTSDELRSRTFKVRHLPTYVREHRIELLHAALTILRAAIVHGKIKETPMPSFERWSDIVREALLFLGLADPLGNQDAETEEDGGGVNEVFISLAKVIGTDKPFSSRQLVEALTSMNAMDDGLIQQLASAGCEAPTDATKVGYWLKRYRNVIAGGYKLVQGEINKHEGTRRWKLVSTQKSMRDFI